MKPEALKICLVDDETDIIESFSENLKSDFQVRTFTSAALALEAFDHGLKPHVVVSDLKMDQIDGITFMQKIRERNLDSRLILMSGQAHREDIIKVMNLGASGFLEKPFTMAQLRQTLNQPPLIAQPPAVGATLHQLNMLNGALEKLSHSYFHRAAEVENFIFANNQNLYSTFEQKKNFFKMLKEQRELTRDVQQLKMKLGKIP